ncbi:hypothetical protein BDZ97DRAFT_1759966 [Flammula alnicola]|nr:hypothetical protein BDZ97DRAFT_1759966 [Flammula alnicola]
MTPTRCWTACGGVINRIQGHPVTLRSLGNKSSSQLASDEAHPFLQHGSFYCDSGKLVRYFGGFREWTVAISLYLWKTRGGLSIVTWIWIAVLFRFNRRPQSTNPLCRSYAHFVSFLFFAVVWLAIGIMLATQMPWECGVSKTLWCAAASFSSALAFCISLFSTGAAIIIYRAAATSGAGLSVNVAQTDKRELPVDDMI